MFNVFEMQAWYNGTYVYGSLVIVGMSDQDLDGETIAYAWTDEALWLELHSWGWSVTTIAKAVDIVKWNFFTFWFAVLRDFASGVGDNPSHMVGELTWIVQQINWWCLFERACALCVIPAGASRLYRVLVHWTVIFAVG